MSWFDLTRPPAAHVAPRVFKTEKRCPRCGGCYPISAFNFRKAARDGLQTYCKPCMLLSSKESLARKAQRLKDRPPAGARKVGAGETAHELSDGEIYAASSHRANPEAHVELDVRIAEIYAELRT